MRFYIADDVLDYKDACLMKDSSEHPNTFIIFRLTVVVNNVKNIVNRVINFAFLIRQFLPHHRLFLILENLY